MKTDKQLVLREGFWYGVHSKELPRPVPLDKPWKGKREFLKALSSVEGLAKKTHYRGFSTCRVCSSHNGSAEFSLRMFGMKWVWPNGFGHYVREHNVRPSLAFQTFITEVANQLEKK